MMPGFFYLTFKLLTMLKVLTDYGIKELQPKRIKAEIKGHLFTVCEVPTKYMNAEEPLYLKRVVHVATGTKLPLTMQHNAPLKDYIQAAEDFLSKMTVERLNNELSNYEILNNIKT